MTDLTTLLLPYQKRICEPNIDKKIVLKARQIGFSFCCGYMCVRKAATKPNSLSLIISMNIRAASELLQKVEQWAHAVKLATNGKLTYTSNSTEVVFSNGSRILSIPGGNPNAARGYTVTGCCIIDEFAYIDNVEELWQATLPTLTNRITGSTPEIILGSTPTSRNSLFGRLWNDNSDFKHYSVNIEEAKKDGLPVDLDELHKLVPDQEQFNVEYMCQWWNAYGVMIDTNLLQYESVDKPICTAHYVGMDVGRFNDKTSMCVIGVDRQGISHLVDLVVMDKADYQTQFKMVGELNSKYNTFQGGYVDAGGIGSVMAEEVNRQINARIKPFNFTGVNKTPAYEKLRGLIFDRKILFKNEFKEQVVDDFNMVERTVSDNGVISYNAKRVNGKGHADLTSSIVLAVNAIHDNPQSFGVIQPVMPYSIFGMS